WWCVALLCEHEEIEIVDIEFRHEGHRGGKVLRLYIDKEGGPNVDDLSRVSHQLSDLLDSHDTVEGAYTLEVSSPGINRPLTRPEHFARFVGKRIRVRTRDMIDSRRSSLGMLEGVLRGGIMLTQHWQAGRTPFHTTQKTNY